MLDINLGALLIQIGSTIALILGLKAIAFKPIGAILDARTQEVKDNLDKVAADRKAMEKLRSEYEERLASIEAEAREHISGAIKQAQEEASAILAKARHEAGEQRDRALAEIDLERRKAVVEIRAQMADLAVIAAGKILEREITPAVHRGLIDDFVKQVSAPN